MDIFDFLTLIGGLSLFLFGMNIMGEALERSAGDKLEIMIGKLTTGKLAGLLTGMGVTAVIQSSSATTVMVVGFVNSKLMSLSQAINVIMGANIGTTVTAWILSLAGISSKNVFIRLLKPSSFTPILALIGVILYMFMKRKKEKDIGLVLLGFATLMFGMETMTGAVSGLKNVPQFTEMFLMFKNPILGVLVGAVLTAIIQSSSASVGILQALASTGAVSYGAAMPIIMGQNIGTCVTALISSIGTTKNAKRAAFVHLSFNVIGTLVCLTAFILINAVFKPAFLAESAGFLGIAVAHSVFNVICTLLLLPMSDILEKIAYRFIPEDAEPDEAQMLDERFLATPGVALDIAKNITFEMAKVSMKALNTAIDCLDEFSESKANEVREYEDKSDYYEDIIGKYLVKLNARQLGEYEGKLSGVLLKAIGDFERISDHAVNILESAEEMRDKGIAFSQGARAEMSLLCEATKEIADRTYMSFLSDSPEYVNTIDALEGTIDLMKEKMRERHIERLQKGECGIEEGFVWCDLITDMERVADHCTNISDSVIELQKQDKSYKDRESYQAQYKKYSDKYLSFT